MRKFKQMFGATVIGFVLLCGTALADGNISTPTLTSCGDIGTPTCSQTDGPISTPTLTSAACGQISTPTCSQVDGEIPTPTLALLLIGTVGSVLSLA